MSSGRNKKKSNNYTCLNKVMLVKGGKPFFDLLLQMIKSAKETIHLQVYIYIDDDTGKEVADALIAAVKREVKVYLLVDGYASKDMSRSFIRSLQEAGIYFRFLTDFPLQ